MKDAALASQIDKPMLICFHVSYSGSFHLMQPVIKDLKEDYGEKLIIVFVEKGKDKEMETLYDINYFPTLLLIWENKVVTRLHGLVSRKELYSYVNLLLLEVGGHHKKINEEK